MENIIQAVAILLPSRTGTCHRCHLGLDPRRLRPDRPSPPPEKRRGLPFLHLVPARSRTRSRSQ
ncbi:hypothetical protein ACHAWF_004233, partial [Thalassiosira exigua]